MIRRDNIPPKLATRLLHWFLKDELLEEVSGDLDEKFRLELKTYSASKARRNYWYQVIKYLRPFAIRSKSKHSKYSSMIKHSLTLAIRGYKKRKSSFLINLVGLSSGLTAVLLIASWVFNELRMDEFHEHSDQLFLVMKQEVSPDHIEMDESTPSLLANGLKAEFPQIAAATPLAFSEKGEEVLSFDQHNLRGTAIYAEPDFFKMFSFDLIQYGASQLADPKSIVLTRSMAEKLFGTTENLIGKEVSYNHDRTFRIDGVCADPPISSTIQFDFVIPYSVVMERIPWLADWRNTYGPTYVMLKDGENESEVSNLIVDFLNKKVKTQDERNLVLKQFSEHYLYGKYENGVQSGGRITYVKLIGIIAGFILVMACVNFMNLSTANATRRLKEIGIKKVVGASRPLLAMQYLLESLLMSCIALVLAIGLTALLWKEFQYVIGQQLEVIVDNQFIVAIVVITLLTGILAGSYPAMYLSGFKPIKVLKGRLSVSSSEVWIRKTLVVFQFTLSIVITVFVGVVYQQIQYTQSKDLGYSRDQVIYFEAEGKAKENINLFVNQLSTQSAVQAASSSYFGFLGSTTGTPAVSWEGKAPDYSQHFAYRMVNYGFTELFDLKLTAGRSFMREMQTDTKSVVINETAAKILGYDNPVGGKLQVWNDSYTILGVVKDFNFQSLYDKIDPMIFMLYPDQTGTVYVKLEAGNLTKGLQATEQVWQEFAPGFPFNYAFLDTEYQKFYEQDRRIADMSGVFAGLAVLISCLGLFGLVVFSTERRVKEIGIRKILGASSVVIMNLLSRDFLQMVLLAVCIGLPIAYLIVADWLEHFAYHLEISLVFMALTGLAALATAWLTISFHTLKAAHQNPVDNLRDE